jgi:hypothetical protein
MSRVISNSGDVEVLAKRRAFNRIVRSAYQPVVAAATLAVVSAASSADGTRATSEQRGIDRGIESSPFGAAHPPSDVALHSKDVEEILGKEVRSSADEHMGRIVNVITDRSVQPRAAIIDFGGFLGIGSRRLAVDWNLLHFRPAGDESGSMIVELTADQVRAAPEYKEGKPLVVLGGPHDPKSHPFTNPTASD